MLDKEAIKLFRKQKKYQSFIKFLNNIEEFMPEELTQEDKEFLDADLCPEADKEWKWTDEVLAQGLKPYPQQLLVSYDDFDKLKKELENPSEPNEKTKEAFKEHTNG